MNILDQRRAEYLNLSTRLVMKVFVPVFAIIIRIPGPEERIVGNPLYNFLASVVVNTHPWSLGEVCQFIS